MRIVLLPAVHSAVLLFYRDFLHASGEPIVAFFTIFLASAVAAGLTATLRPFKKTFRGKLPSQWATQPL